MILLKIDAIELSNFKQFFSIIDKLKFVDALISHEN